MKKKMPLIIMMVVLILCIAGYFGIRDIEWEDTGNPNATTVDNTQTISEALEAAEEESAEGSAEEATDGAEESDELTDGGEESEEMTDGAEESEEMTDEADESETMEDGGEDF